MQELQFNIITFELLLCYYYYLLVKLWTPTVEHIHCSSFMDHHVHHC